MGRRLLAFEELREGFRYGGAQEAVGIAEVMIKRGAVTFAIAHTARVENCAPPSCSRTFRAAATSVSRVSIQADIAPLDGMSIAVLYAPGWFNSGLAKLNRVGARWNVWFPTQE